MPATDVHVQGRPVAAAHGEPWPGRACGRPPLPVAGRGKPLLLHANPLDDIANIRRIRAVMAAGRLFDRSTLDRLSAEAKAAAQ